MTSEAGGELAGITALQVAMAARLSTLGRCVAIAALMVTLFARALAAEAPPPTLAGPALLAALRAGGLIIYFRHTSTDFGQNDEQMTGYEDCARQRNLTDQGREEARLIGAAIKRLGLPIGEVLASPFCRTMETAKLMFGRAQATAAVRGGPARPDSPDRYAELKKLLSTPPAPGTDLVIASHGNPFAAVAGTPYLAEGEAAVIRPLGAQGFAIVARITKDGWSALEAPSSTKSSSNFAPSSLQAVIAVRSCRATTASA